MWANYEAEYQRISTDHALMLCDQYGVTMDWIYRGRTENLHPELLERIRSHSETRESREEDQAG
jgi:hypothetical protein